MNRIERLEKVLNKTSGNPYHDSEGKFTFSPSSFKNTSGKDAEVTDNPRDWYLTDLSRKNINKVPEISSTKELKDYLSSNGIKSDIDNPSIKKHEDYENIKFDALKKQASGIVASVEFCKAVFGKESLSKLKEIKFYSSESETTGSFDVMLKGEKPSNTNGILELSTDITNRGILHEFIHVVQDSTKRKSQDCVLWSKEILDKTGVNSKAYTGANTNHLPAEQLADLISFGIANGKNLEDVSKVINYIKKNKTENSIQLNGGPGSGNFNPGQDRGVGKQSKKISYEEYVANKKENNSRINRLVNLENRINNRKSSGNVKLNKILNSQKENLDYRYDIKAYKEYLKEWLKHKDEKDKTSKNSLKIDDYLRNNLSAKSYFRSQRLSSILNKVNRGNPYHDKFGRFTSGHGSGKIAKENNATKIYEKYKNRKNPNPKSLSDEERELRIRTIINNAEIMGINLEDIKKDDAYKIMKFIGWEENENGTVSTEFGLEKISDKEIKDGDYISFNGTDSKEGFDSLRDGGYRSKIIDEDDGPGIYTSEYYDTALNYSKGEGEVAHEERVTAIKINNSNIVSRDDVNKRLRNFNRNFLRNLPDSSVAALAGYDAMWTGNGDKEIVILKPSSAEIIELDEN